MKQQEQENVAENAENNVETTTENNTDTVETPAVEVDNTAAELEATKEKLAATQERLLRLQADFDNFRKRQDRERIEFVKRANEDFAEDIVGVLDSFDHAFKSIPAAQQNDENPFFKGFSLVKNSFLSVLGKNGVTPIEDPVGKPLDPNTMEAVSIMTTGTVPPGAVLYVTRQGYLLNGRVLRATQVVVEQELEEEAPPAPAAESAPEAPAEGAKEA